MAQKRKTAAEWKARKRHSIKLPSGFDVAVEIPNLPRLVKTGQLPNDLVSEALSTIQNQNLTPEIIAKQSDFYDKLIIETVKDPELTEEDVREIPFEDIELIAELATRQRDVDAVGHHIGGLHTSKDWRSFRGLPALSEDVEDIQVGG